MLYLLTGITQNYDGDVNGGVKYMGHKKLNFSTKIVCISENGTREAYSYYKSCHFR